MARRDELRAVLYNLVFDLVRTRVPSNIAAAILRNTIDSWERLVGSDPDGHPETDEQAAAVLDDVLVHVPLDSLCQGPAVQLGATAVSRVTDHLAVWTNNIHKASVAPPRDGLPDARFWRDIEADGLAQDHVIPDSVIRGGRPFAWITTRETMAMIRERNPQQLATEVRDHLGLDHFDAGSELLELQYPGGALADTRVAAPTFIEGGTNATYMSVTSGDGWGKTRHLRGGEGGPEAVHPPIRFTHHFAIRYLGEVDCEPPSFDPSSIARPREWDREEAEILMAVLGQEPA